MHSKDKQFLLILLGAKDDIGLMRQNNAINALTPVLSCFLQNRKEKIITFKQFAD